MLMLAVFDTALQPYKNDVPTEMLNVGATGAPFTAGLILLVLGARKINQHFLTLKSKNGTVPSQ